MHWSKKDDTVQEILGKIGPLGQTGGLGRVPHIPRFLCSIPATNVSSVVAGGRDGDDDDDDDDDDDVVVGGVTGVWRKSAGDDS